MDKIDFSGKVAIITGASSGIGAETAVTFAGYGVKLALVGRNEARLLETVEKCAAKTQSDAGNRETVIAKTVEIYGRIDVLVNCAGKVAISSLFDNSMETLDELMDINFRVPYHLSLLSLPYLIKTKGNIINIGSSMSKRAKPGLMPYTVSKAAIQLFSRHAALELASNGVRINSISPGHTKTNILANIGFSDYDLKETISQLASSMPGGKMLEPKEEAFLICLTASDVFPSLNGSDLMLDGGANMV